MNDSAFLMLASGKVGFEAVSLFRENFGSEAVTVVWDETSEHEPPRDCLEINPTNLNLIPLPEFDLGLLAWWPKIIAPEIIGKAKRGFLNVHPSFLPDGRGKDPNFWCLVEEKPFGVSIHKVTERVDFGPIVLQKEFPVTWESTGESLYTWATENAATLLLQGCIQYLNHSADLIDVDYSSSRPPRRRSELEPVSVIKLDSTYSARELLNLIRARTFKGHPGCSFIDESNQVFEVRVEIKKLPHHENSGT